ncbi:unnamed protein product [Symbiodinium natans]|uniref:Uncharacterized protein n=1 Tax=Symbiodinium natans TaxID=878477 RepID=A0A812U309_9DINO|nr:unnamed protein product [Symbiodinium natans]
MQDTFDAGCLLSLGVLIRLAAAAINYEIYCMLDGSASDVPSITELSDYATGTRGPWRYALSLLSVVFSDGCCCLVLLHASVQLHGRHTSGASLLQALVIGSSGLDFVQAATTEFRLHYVLIQMAGCTMCLTLLHILFVLYRTGRQTQRIQTACFTFTVLCMDLVLVAALHNHWIREQSLSSVTWTALEYLGMVLYTAVMVQIGGLLPAATVKLGWLPRIVSDESAAAKSLLPKHSPDSGRPYNKVGA